MTKLKIIGLYLFLFLFIIDIYFPDSYFHKYAYWIQGKNYRTKDRSVITAKQVDPDTFRYDFIMNGDFHRFYGSRYANPKPYDGAVVFKYITPDRKVIYCINQGQVCL